jgi:hypothetical protein
MQGVQEENQEYLTMTNDGDKDIEMIDELLFSLILDNFT